MSPFGDTRIFPFGNFMAHDCWFCKTMRAVVVVGFSMYAIIGFVGFIESLVRMHWMEAGKEFLGILLCVVMIPIGLTALRVWSRQMDRLDNVAS